MEAVKEELFFTIVQEKGEITELQPSHQSEFTTESLPSHQEEESEFTSESVPAPPPPPLPLEEVEAIIGYNFKDQSLLKEAFTHTTYGDGDGDGDGDESSYERLEYLGDSVLNLLVAREHYMLYPDLGPGKLTPLRAANVDKEKLARVAINHNLDKYLRHNKPLLDAKIREFKDAILKYPLHSNGLIYVPKTLADIVESTIGAIFLDTNSSLDTTWKVVEKLLQPVITPATFEIHPVTNLHELCQKHGLTMRFVDLWSETGEIEIYVNDEFVGRGKYREKRTTARHTAAKNAYKEIMRRLRQKKL